MITPANADSGALLYERARAQYFAGKSADSSPVRRRAFFFAASELRKFIEAYPSHPKVPDGYFNLGSLYTDLYRETNDREDAFRSLNYFRELVRTSPRDRLADDALFQAAQVCRDLLQDKACEEESLAQLRKEYPRGDMSRKLSVEAVSAAPETSQAVGPVTVEGVRVENLGGAWQFHLKLGSPRDVSATVLAADPAKNMPERFFFDLPAAKRSPSLKEQTFSAGAPVKRVRFGQRDEGTVRVVFDLAPETKAADLKLISEPEGLAVQFGEVAVAVETPVAPESAIEIPVVVEAATPVPVPTAEQVLFTPPTKEQKVIVVDAGHGGEDVGARGPRGTLEKDICLSVAHRVATLLKERPQYRVLMTRTDDRFIELSERTRMANTWQGDLFVSIHANASPKKTARGISTYFLNNADDAESLRVAMRENAVLKPSSVKTQTDTSSDYYLEITKAAMVKKFHTDESSYLAADVQRTMVEFVSKKYRDAENLGVRSAGFFVLTGAEMPAILVETSFISHATEEKRLRDSKYQTLLAEAIAKGIDRFFKSPMGRGDHTALYRQR